VSFIIAQPKWLAALALDSLRVDRIDDARAQVEETLSLSERYPNERAFALLTLARINVAAGSPRGRFRR
tara:strand:+ start:13835 stop:14041 length:207 start_codon:yes stop_codon:yes gene_type:complete